MSDDNDLPFDYAGEPGGPDPREQQPANITKTQALTLANINSRNLQQFIDQIDARASLWKALRKKALQQTSNEDWTVMGDKPYWQRGAVSAIFSFLGCEVRDLKKLPRESDTDKTGRLDYYYSTTGKMDWNGKTVEEIGMASTRDQFFAQRTNKETKEKYLLPLEEIDLQDVDKKSITNLYSRLLARIFKAPSLAELKDAGINPGSKVTYSTGSQGGSTDTADTKNLRTELGNTILAIGKITNEEGPAILKRLTSFPGKDGGKDFPGYDSLNKVSEKMLQKTLSKAKDELKAQQEGSAQ